MNTEGAGGKYSQGTDGHHRLRQATPIDGDSQHTDPLYTHTLLLESSGEDSVEATGPNCLIIKLFYFSQNDSITLLVVVNQETESNLFSVKEQSKHFK